MNVEKGAQMSITARGILVQGSAPIMIMKSKNKVYTNLFYFLLIMSILC